MGVIHFRGLVVLIKSKVANLALVNASFHIDTIESGSSGTMYSSPGKKYKSA